MFAERDAELRELHAELDGLVRDLDLPLAVPSGRSPGRSNGHSPSSSGAIFTADASPDLGFFSPCDRLQTFGSLPPRAFSGQTPRTVWGSPQSASSDGDGAGLGLGLGRSSAQNATNGTNAMNGMSAMNAMNGRNGMSLEGWAGHQAHQAHQAQQRHQNHRENGAAMHPSGGREPNGAVESVSPRSRRYEVLDKKIDSLLTALGAGANDVPSAPGASSAPSAPRAATSSGASAALPRASVDQRIESLQQKMENLLRLRSESEGGSAGAA
ncbi:unnamed protein product [Effrenium voratum]|nr:unnamed protein product [Effrenium voratum]